MYKRIDITSAEDFFDIRDVTHISRKILEKTASDSNYDQELINFIDTVDKKPDKYYLLLNAMGAGEHYGSNRNGDYFSDKALRQYHKTFETNAQVYKHHKNKPQLGHPTFGKVLFSHYNEKMKRVELIVELDVNAAPDLKEKIDRGEFPPVSMGAKVPYDTCLAGDSKILTEVGYIPIAELLDEPKDVYGISGKTRQVSAAKVRTVNHYLELKIFGDYSKIKVTEEHPFLIAPKEQFMEGKTVRFSSFRGELQTKWVEAGNLRVGDYVLHKKLEKTPDIFTTSEARLFGYYLSEGSIVKEKNEKIAGLRFSFNINEEFTHVAEILEMFPKAKKYLNIQKNECAVTLYDKELAIKFKQMGGEYSYHKFISPKILSSSDEILYNILGTLINGDGSQDHNKRKGQIRYTTVGENLARSIRRLCLELGVLSSINTQLFRNKFDNQKNFTRVYNISIPGSFSEKLSKYSSKVIPYNFSVGSRLRQFGGYIVIPIKSINIKSKSLSVYNLQVEEDETYYVNEYITHNCSICGNKAKKVENYCDHAKYMMNRVLPDGRKVFVYNDQPKFFDISFVLIPADRTAGMLAKVANAQQPALSAELGEQYLKQAGIKEADIEKRIPGAEIKEVASDPKRLIYESQPDMPRELVDELSDSQLPLEKILSTLLGMRIMPKREEFQRIVLCNSGKRDLADDLESKKIIFVVHRNTQPIVPRGVSFDNFSEEIARAIRSRDEYINRAPMTKPVIILRVMEKMAASIDPREGSATEQSATNVNAPYDPKKGKNVQFGYGLNLGYSKENEPEISPVKNPALALSALGGIYAGYRHLMEPFKPAAGFDKLFMQNPWLWPVLIGATSLGTVALQEKLMEKKSSLDPGLLTRAFVAVPSTYLYSGLQEHKARQGQPISEIGNIVRQYPFLSSIAATWGSGKALRLLDTARYKFASNSNTMTDIFFSLNPTDFDQMFQDIVC